MHEIQCPDATVEPGHCTHDTQRNDAGLTPFNYGRQYEDETQKRGATVEPGHAGSDTQYLIAGLTSFLPTGVNPNDNPSH